MRERGRIETYINDIKLNDAFLGDDQQIELDEHLDYLSKQVNEPGKHPAHNIEIIEEYLSSLKNLIFYMMPVEVEEMGIKLEKRSELSGTSFYLIKHQSNIEAMRKLKLEVPSFEFTGAKIWIKSLRDMKRKVENKSDLTNLCDMLEETAKNSKPTSKTYADVIDCSIETKRIIDDYEMFKDRAQALKNDAKNDPDAIKKLEKLEANFIKSLNKFEYKCSKYTLPQKLIRAAFMVVGGLLGVALGYVIGALVSGGAGALAGSIVPGFGTLAGAVIAGKAGGIIAAIQGLGIGLQVASAAAVALMGLGMAAGNKAGKSSVFFSPQQKAVADLKSGMQKEIKSETKKAKLDIHRKKAEEDKKAKAKAPQTENKESLFNRLRNKVYKGPSSSGSRNKSRI